MGYRKPKQAQGVIYELGRWSELYMAEKSSKIIHFFCWKCKIEIHGISMYEHWATCNPGFFRRLNKYKGRRLGHVKQGRRGAFDVNGVSEELQYELLPPGSEEDRNSLWKVRGGALIESFLEPLSKEIGRLEDDSKDKET